MATYGTLSGWRAWALARGNTAPTDATDADATAALQRGSDYVALRYVTNLRPECSVDQNVSGVDLPLGEVANYFAADFELTTPGFFSTTYTPAQQKVLTKAGSIGWTVVGAGADSTYGASPTSTALESLFRNCIFDPDRGLAGVWAVGT